MTSARNWSAVLTRLWKNATILDSGLPDGLLSHQKYQFWYILQDFGVENFYGHLVYVGITIPCLSAYIGTYAGFEMPISRLQQVISCRLGQK
jgi:hypothetical protein